MNFFHKAAISRGENPQLWIQCQRSSLCRYYTMSSLCDRSNLGIPSLGKIIGQDKAIIHYL